jgi:hypothetical protein
MARPILDMMTPSMRIKMKEKVKKNSSSRREFRSCGKLRTENWELRTEN